jgi:hypothetical protein
MALLISVAMNTLMKTGRPHGRSRVELEENVLNQPCSMLGEHDHVLFSAEIVAEKLDIATQFDIPGVRVLIQRTPQRGPLAALLTLPLLCSEWV